MESLGTIRPNPLKPCASVPKRVQLRGQSQVNCVQVPVLAPLSSLCLSYSPLLKHRLVVPKSRCHQGSPVCLLGGKDKSSSGNQGPSWNPLGQDMGNLRGKSIEEVLREQIEKKEYYNGGSGRKPPRGSGGSGDGSGGSDDERIRGILDETLQVVLATAGFIFLYVCMISGQEMTKLANDYIKFLLGGTKSSRLKRAMNKWRRFTQILSRKEEKDEHWLEREITDNSTSFDSPEQYERIWGEDFATSD